MGTQFRYYKFLLSWIPRYRAGFWHRNPLKLVK